jgi:hypothetical protein
MSDSLFLCARPSFAEGASRLFDFANVLNTYNTAPSPDEADLMALREDWRLIGEDWGQAIEQVASQHCKP